MKKPLFDFLRVASRREMDDRTRFSICGWLVEQDPGGEERRMRHTRRSHGRPRQEFLLNFHFSAIQSGLAPHQGAKLAYALLQQFTTEPPVDRSSAYCAFYEAAIMLCKQSLSHPGLWRGRFELIRLIHVGWEARKA